MKFNARVVLLALAAIGGSNAAIEETSFACDDNLAQSPSFIKECNVLIQSFACGSEMYGTNVDDVCKRTCGLCGDGSDGGSEDDFDNAPSAELPLGDTNNAASSSDGEEGGGYKKEATSSIQIVRLNPEFATLEYTDFNVTDDFVEITTHVPESTDWFGFHFYTYTSVPGDEK